MPLMAWFTVKKLILEPREAAAREKERLRRMEANKEKVAEAKREALASCNLMTERFRRSDFGIIFIGLWSLFLYYNF